LRCKQIKKIAAQKLSDFSDSEHELFFLTILFIIFQIIFLSLFKSFFLIIFVCFFSYF